MCAQDDTGQTPENAISCEETGVLSHLMRQIPKSLQLDAIDRSILSELQNDGRLPNVELAARVHLSPSACQRQARSDTPGSSPSTETASASRHCPLSSSIRAPRSVRTCSAPFASVSLVPVSLISISWSIPSSWARERIDSTAYFPAASTGLSGRDAPKCAHPIPAASTNAIPTRPNPMCRLPARVRRKTVQAGGHAGDASGRGGMGTAVPTRGTVRFRRARGAP